MAAALRFNAERHEYFYNDVRVPSITQMLVATGWTDPKYYTEAGRDRGTAVHDLVTAYDLGALTLATVPDKLRGYVLAYVEAMQALRPTFHAIEEMSVHPGYPFAGRPDRVAQVFAVRSIYEVKSGAPEQAHAVQTALQAILEAGKVGGDHRLPATSYQRLAIYLKPSGRYTLAKHPNRRDFDHAAEVLNACCPKGDRR
jgi:hypothetical protein